MLTIVEVKSKDKISSVYTMKRMQDLAKRNLLAGTGSIIASSLAGCLGSVSSNDSTRESNSDDVLIINSRQQYILQSFGIYNMIEIQTDGEFVLNNHAAVLFKSSK